MFDAKRVVLVGATGLIGRTLIERARQPLTAIARRKVSVPPPSELIVADPGDWPQAIAEARPQALVIALGTTWNQAGRDEAAFRAVDQELVLACAKAARQAGAEQCIAVSSVGAAPRSASFYLRVKGEVEEALRGIGFARLDLLRPGLLRGERDGDRRIGERVAMLASPVTDSLLHGGLRKYRSVSAETVADAILGLLGEAAPGAFVHENDASTAPRVDSATRPGHRPLVADRAGEFR